ncbi:hypothetical protein MTO96_020678 [Rhipicephalus appendiculatus]
MHAGPAVGPAEDVILCTRLATARYPTLTSATSRTGDQVAAPEVANSEAARTAAPFASRPCRAALRFRTCPTPFLSGETKDARFDASSCDDRCVPLVGHPLPLRTVCKYRRVEVTQKRSRMFL